MVRTPSPPPSLQRAFFLGSLVLTTFCDNRNTIGYSYWFFRFMSQCVYYALVYFAALFQVYDRGNPNPSIGHFIAILIVGAGFLWLEFLQAMRSWHRYKKSSYNFLDLLAYGLPMIASIDQIIVHQMQDVNGNTQILSFSVLVIFLHMVKNMRIGTRALPSPSLLFLSHLFVARFQFNSRFT